MNAFELCRQGLDRQASGDLIGALAEFEQALALDPRCAQAFNCRAINRYLRRDDGALADLDHALQIEPRHAGALNNRGFIRRAEGDLNAAVADFDRALAAEPTYVDALSNRGLARLDLGDTDLALADFEAALAMDPRNVILLHNRGAAHLRRGEAAQAIIAFTEALACDPTFAASYDERGLARKELCDLAGALADFDRAVELASQEATASICHHRGGVLVLLNRFAEAIRDYDHALQIDPGMVTAYISRGNARYHLRDLAGLADYRTAFRLDPAVAAQELARHLLESAQRLDPQTILEKCAQHLRIMPNDPIAAARRGLTLLLLGRTTEAESDFATFAALVPDAATDFGAVLRIVRGSAKVST